MSGSLRASAYEFSFRNGVSSRNSTMEAKSFPLRLSATEFIPGAVNESGRRTDATNNGHSDNRPVPAANISGVNDFVPTLNPTATLFQPGDNPTRPDLMMLDVSAACYTPQPGNYCGGEHIVTSSFPFRSESCEERGVSPTTRKIPVCRFFQKGACRRGLHCTFSHDIAALDRAGDDAMLRSRNFFHQQHGIAAENVTEFFKVVDNGIRSHFGPGLGVLKLELGLAEDPSAEKDRKRVLISGLSPQISDFDVEARLSTFGSISFIHRKHESYAYCNFENSEQAAGAVASLNGTPQNTWSGLTTKQGGSYKKGYGFVSVSIAAEAGNASKSSRNATVKLHWYSPSRVAWLHFQSRKQAETAAKKCHQKLFSRRKLSTKMQSPSWHQKTSFSVWMGGLGETVNKPQLSQFVKKVSGSYPMSIDLEDPPFLDKNGAQIVRRLLLSEGGPLVQFDEDQDNLRFPHNLKRKALARFAKAEDAARACTYFQITARVSGLGGTKVHCQRVFSAKFTLPAQIFKVVNESLVGIFQSQDEDIRFKVFQNANSTSSLLVQADDAKKLAETKRLLSDIIDGVLVLDPACQHDQKIPLWQDCFETGETERFATEKVRQRFGHDRVLVLFQKRRHEVRLFSRTSLRQEAIQFVCTLLCDLKPNVQAVPIGRERYKFLLAGGRDTLNELIAACHGNSVSLDLKNQSLLVEGSPSDAS